MRLRGLALVLILAVPSTRGQSLVTVHGRVVSKSGKPVKGAGLRGDYYHCCPSELELLTTNDDGVFSFQHPTPFIHVLADGFRALTLFIQPGQSELNVTLEDETVSTLVLPACPVAETKTKRIGIWFRFALPRKTKVVRRHDVDVGGVSIRYPHGNYWLNMASGYTLGGSLADESVMKDSAKFSERWIDLPDKSSIGIDAIGQHKDGKFWRSFGTSVDQASYYEAPADAAKYFDEVISQVCISREFLNAGQQVH